MRKLLFFLLPLHLSAQPTSFEAFKHYPFPTELCASAKGSKIAWALNEQGVRNVYVAQGPDFTPRQLTRYSQDDGQEITSLTISPDGKYVVFVRGGDHGGNWDNSLPTDPTSGLEPFKMQIASLPFDGGDPKYLAEGDYPVISPDGKQVAFIKNGQVWAAPVDGSATARRLFTTRGTLNSLEWRPAGSALVFVADLGDHSVIGIYTDSTTPLKWIAPSFSRDLSPRWSPDGSRIVFVRRPASGGAPDSLLTLRPTPWSLYIAEIATNKATLLWQSPHTLRGSWPTTDGEANLHWGAGNKIVFLSYQDGWPHLYAIDATSTINAASTIPITSSTRTTPTIPTTRPKEQLLTPGSFMCEHIALSADRRYLTFSANTGNDPNDIERRHAAIVNLDDNKMQVLTPGDGLEWTPILPAEGNVVAFIHATAQQPPLPAIMPLNGDRKITLLGADRIPADFPKDKLITPKAVTFLSADGLTIHADLFLPPGGTAKKAAIIFVHGGPPREMLLGWHYSDYYSNAYACNQYLASLGFVVLAVNYRLGIGYGYAFHQPPHAGVRGAAEYLDIRAAGRWLQQQTFVDPERVGIYGGSYGGYLTALALGRDSRLFKAGVDISGVHDRVTQTPQFNSANPYERAPDYDEAVKTAWSSSPISAVDTWTSPVLIIHADDDRNVRFAQSIELINRLQKKGVPCETMMIPDDTHDLLRWANQVTVYGAAADFLVKHFHPGG
jgi:dipeptidyl aminopeptidase/acylaminoacyl peptidase